jgi:hypothetical protein
MGHITPPITFAARLGFKTEAVQSLLPYAAATPLFHSVQVRIG